MKIFLYICFVIICIFLSLIAGDVAWVESKKAILIDKPIPFALTLLCMLVIPFVEYKKKNNEAPLLLNTKNRKGFN